MHVAFILCDAAQVADNKVHILGAGWRICGPVVQGHAVVAIVTFDPMEQGVEHQVALELVDEDGHPVVIPTPQGPMTVRAEGPVRADALPGVPAAMEIDVPFLAQIGPGLPLAPGSRYVWQMWIDGNTNDAWRVTFYVRQAPE